MPWPPLLLIGTIGLGVGLNYLVPSPPFLGSPITRASGLVLAAAALLLDAAAVLTLLRNRTTVLPHRAAALLVTNGPYRLSRNPIYTGNVLLTVGLALAIGNVCFWRAPPPRLSSCDAWLFSLESGISKLASVMPG